MNHISIIRVLAFLGIGLGSSMALPLFVAILNGETQQILAFSFTGILTIIMAGMILLLSGMPDRDARVNDALAVAILWCFGAPIPAALPFVFGTAEPNFLAGLHEAVSCLTTTGHSVIDLGGNVWPKSLLVWRGVLHFLGMIFGLTIAASVFAALGFAGPGIHRSYLFTVPDGSFFDALPRAIRSIFVICACLILSVFAIFIMNGMPPATALSLAISVASTGLVSPVGYDDVAMNTINSGALFIGLFFATSGIAVMMNLRPQRLRYAEIDPEVYLLVIAIILIGALAWQGGLAILPAGGWALSAISTSGLPVGAPISEVKANLPLSLLVLPALIGGAALSSAGGIKLARIIILIRRAGQEFNRLGYQNSVVGLSFKERQQKETAVLGVWVYLIGYIGAVSFIFTVLAFLGIDFPRAIGQATGAISNSGWLIEVPVGASGKYHCVIAFAMILGRLEVLALLPALNPAFWSR